MSAITLPLKFREFRLFWIATAISFTGDQLTFIALPWLVLKLTGDALVMGTVIAIAAVPRAVFMLVGGAVTDRYSPRVVMLISNCVRMCLVGALSIWTYTELIDVWTIYAIAFAFGLADAFMFPAMSAYPPRLLPKEQLAAGNSLAQGMGQLTLVVGPLVAGGLIAVFIPLQVGAIRLSPRTWPYRVVGIALVGISLLGLLITTSRGADDTLSQDVVVTDGNGIAVVQLTSLVAGETQISARDIVSGVTIFGSATVAFTQGEALLLWKRGGRSRAQAGQVVEAPVAARPEGIPFTPRHQFQLKVASGGEVAGPQRRRLRAVVDHQPAEREQALAGQIAP